MHRQARRWAAWLMVGAVGGASWAAGCRNSAGDCERTLTCDHHAPGTGGTGGGTPAGCVPSENADAVGDECGVFVSAGGDDAAAGTKAAPVQTIAAAITRAMEGGGRVYACAETFAGAVEVPTGMTIFGGLDCANGWMWVGEAQKTVVEGGADEIALRVSGGEGAVRIEDVAVNAADAVAAGGSSIAVLVDGATAELVRCELTAGNGAEGAEGAPGAERDGMGQIPAAAAGMPGNAGVNACSDLDMSGMPDAALLGGAPMTNDCGANQQSIGGGGGTGNIANGGPGGPGETGTLGAAGAGEPGMGAWSCAVEGEGQGGSDGMPGMPGLGATGSGTLSSTTGYAGVSGGAGTTGQPGQGGGGGGGAKGGNAICPGALAGAGASGGSGGAGGCGGQPGQGGGPGGASIALASVNAQVTLTGCRLTAGSGGRGGAGGDFQPGGSGGQGGIGGTGVGGSKAACDGGKGGQGGNGGPGGGGLGGPSAAIAHVGAAVVKDAGTTLTPGAAGDGGPGGNADLAMNSGAQGAAAEELELP